MKKKILLYVISGLLLFFLGGLKAEAATSAWPSGVPAPPASDLKIDGFFNPIKDANTSSKYPQTIIVTPGATKNDVNKLGGIWSRNRIDLNNSFTYSMWLWLGKKNGLYNVPDAASDGIAFLLQNDSKTKTALGTSGGGIGAYSYGQEGGGGSTSYVKDSLAIEMDSWWNNIANLPAEHFDEDIPYAANSNGHTAFVQPKDLGKNSRLGHIKYWYERNPATDDNKDPKYMLANDHWRLFNINWVPEVTWQNGKRILGGKISYTFGDNYDAGDKTVDPKTRMPGDMSLDIPDVNSYFGVDSSVADASHQSVLYGFTGSTGGTPNFQAASTNKLPQVSVPVTLDFVIDGTTTKLINTMSLNGEAGAAWNGAERRQEWIQYKNEWYQYTGTYKANTPDGKDNGTFSATTGYNVTYNYKKQTPPENYALKKAVKNVTANDANWVTDTTGKTGDNVSYELTYTNLTNISSGDITDKLPSNITYTKGSLQMASPDSNWEYKTIDDSIFISNQTVKFPYVIPAGGSFKLKLNGAINSGVSPGDKIINNATAGTSSSSVKSNDAIVTINKLPYKGSIEKGVLNETNKETKYQSKTSGQVDDLVKYQIKVKPDANSADKLTTIDLKDVVSDPTSDLDIDNNSILVTYADGSTQKESSIADIKLKDMVKGDSATITYSGTVKRTTVGEIENKASVTAKTSGNETYSDSSKADVEVTEPRNTNMTIRYVDLDDNLASPTYISTEVSAAGKPKAALSTVISDRVAPKVLNDYTVISVTNDTDLTKANWSDAYKDDPLFDYKDKVITYGYKKAMISIDAPKLWDFGTNDPAQSDTTYYLKTAENKPQKISVVDNYGVQSWQLKVQQSTAFISTDTDKHELTDAQLRITNGNVIANKDNTAKGNINSKDKFNIDTGSEIDQLMTFTKLGTYQDNDEKKDQSSKDNPYTNPGKGAWDYQFGDEKTANYSVGLHVPATTKRYKTHYQTELTWSLTVAP